MVAVIQSILKLSFVNKENWAMKWKNFYKADLLQIYQLQRKSFNWFPLVLALGE